MALRAEAKNMNRTALSGKSRAICDAIERRLVRGHYLFGQEVLANDLVTEFGASRAPDTNPDS